MEFFFNFWFQFFFFLFNFLSFFGTKLKKDNYDVLELFWFW